MHQVHQKELKKTIKLIDQTNFVNSSYLLFFQQKDLLYLLYFLVHFQKVYDLVKLLLPK